jgi:YedE family putative selenium metabolism protein
MMGGIRDIALFKDFYLISGFAAVFAAVLIGNAIFGTLNFGFAGQPIAHTDGLWNFLGMALVGLGSVFLGGCPLRQLILAGSGNSDSALTVMGFIAGAAICHNFGLASSASGATAGGKIAVIVCLALCAVIGFCSLRKNH